MVIPAKYEHGVFKPLEDVLLEEGTVVEVYLPQPKASKTRKSIRESGIFGIWKQRGEIENGIDYVNKVRDNPRDYEL